MVFARKAPIRCRNPHRPCPDADTANGPHQSRDSALRAGDGDRQHSEAMFRDEMSRYRRPLGTISTESTWCRQICRIRGKFVPNSRPTTRKLDFAVGLRRYGRVRLCLGSGPSGQTREGQHDSAGFVPPDAGPKFGRVFAQGLVAGAPLAPRYGRQRPGFPATASESPDHAASE